MENLIIPNRPRRNRKGPGIRELIKENSVETRDLIAPLFLIEGDNKKVKIDSMPGQFRFSLDNIIEEAKELYQLGIHSLALFPVIDEKLKCSYGKESLNPNGLYLTAIKEFKKACPDMVLMTDIALDPYSSDGHDGVVDPSTGEIKNDETLSLLGEMAVAQAKAGADILGPSDMMDGRIGVIREYLDKNDYVETSIMSYAIKYASYFYGPFRDALDSTPKKGDKKTYQMDFSNSREAIREAQLDEREGADILMVKPGLPYLDVIKTLRENTNLPVAAYNVSGEYAMIKAAGEKGWLDSEMAMVESLTAFKRAGCDIILTYFAKEMAEFILKKNRS